jgi:hypothetical protein
VIEITTFRTRPSASDDDLLRADEALRTAFLYQQPGLERATTARGRDGTWLMVVLWESDADADAAARRAESDDTYARWLALVDAATIDRARFDTLG